MRMNGIDKITQRIDSDTQKEIDKILSAAKAEVASINEKYQAQAKKEAADLAVRNEKVAVEQEERLVSVSQMEARKVTLAAKQDMVEEAFRLALDKLCNLPDDVYINTVAKLMTEAAPDGRGTVIFAKDEHDRIGQKAVDEANRLLENQGKLTLSDETRPIRGGFILANDRVEVNCTFETLVRLQKGEIAGEVAKRLFPET